ncbi:uncharacterized protein LOC113420466 [Notechis scutatus]|uniref:Uncharacterized protein LOC113420466 n=1 Tax=Notechis scutatus TaxID=8663 RepID=A0A6J1V0C8_9SAUR|nr:uncharacterized protein LOC113420466 [Notechis scutatus]
MEGFPGLQLLLMLVGLFASCTSYLFPSPSTASLQNTGKSPKEVVLTQGTSLRIKAFCAYQYLQGQPVWCKEKQQNELGWQYMTSKAKQKIVLEGVVNGCISLLMKNLQIEDSGRYWFGILSGMKMVSINSIKVVVHYVEHVHFLPNKTAPPPTMRMPFTSTISGMTMQEVIKVQGESLSVKAFCSQQHAQAERVWCKEELPEECSLEKLISFSGSRWKGLTTQPDQRIIVNDLGDGCIYVFMSALQSEDTGIYWFGVLDGPNIIPLRNIRVIVQKDQQKEDIGTASSEDEQRYQPFKLQFEKINQEMVHAVGSIYLFTLRHYCDYCRVNQVVWVLVFIAVGVTILSAFTLVVVVLTKRKRRVADDQIFDDNPNCRIINLQIHESNTAQSLHEGMNTIYSAVKLPRISRDVNRTFPLRSNVNRTFP